MVVCHVLAIFCLQLLTTIDLKSDSDNLHESYCTTVFIHMFCALLLDYNTPACRIGSHWVAANKRQRLTT